MNDELELEIKPQKKTKTIKPNGPWRSGLYEVVNTHKYLGDLDNVIYRSSWEKKFFKDLDMNEHILGWASEPFAIEYMKPCIVNGKPSVKPAKYYPDIYVEYINSKGQECRKLIEIKPEKQTKPSRAKKLSVRLQENHTHAINTSKWKAAQKWCDAHGIEFQVATEKSLFR